jgi:hypothetical protein
LLTPRGSGSSKALIGVPNPDVGRLTDVVAGGFVPGASLAVVVAFDCFVETRLVAARVAAALALASAARRLAGAAAAGTLLARAFDDFTADNLDAPLARDFLAAGVAPARSAATFLAARLTDALLAGDFFAAGLAPARFAGAVLAGAFLAGAFLAAAISGLPPGGSNEGL